MGTRLSGRGELLAGCAAVVVLAALVVIFDVGVLFAVALAVATYFGVLFLRDPASPWPATPWAPVGRWWRQWPANDIREATPDERTYAAAFARALDLRALTPRIVDPAVRTQMDRILVRVDQILTAMADDRDMSKIPVFDACLLEPLHELLAAYVRLVERGVQSGGDVLAWTESHDLPLILEALDDFFERLHSRHLTDLATMSELIELNLESVRAMMRRRATP